MSPLSARDKATPPKTVHPDSVKWAGCVWLLAEIKPLNWPRLQQCDKVSTVTSLAGCIIIILYWTLLFMNGWLILTIKARSMNKASAGVCSESWRDDSCWKLPTNTEITLPMPQSSDGRDIKTQQKRSQSHSSFNVSDLECKTRKYIQLFISEKLKDRNSGRHICERLCSFIIMIEDWPYIKSVPHFSVFFKYL